MNVRALRLVLTIALSIAMAVRPAHAQQPSSPPSPFVVEPSGIGALSAPTPEDIARP